MSPKETRSLLNLVDHKKTLNFIDLIFGGYCLIMMVVSFAAWWQGLASLTPLISIAVFFTFNMVISEISKRTINHRRLEGFRSVLGPFMCIFAYWGTQELFGGWWTCFLIMCIGGNILHTMQTRNAFLGRSMVLIYVSALVITILLSRPNRDWYMMMVYVGAIAISGLLFVEVLLVLSKTLFSERESKNEIAEQKIQVEEQRAIIERKSSELETTYIRLTDSIRYAKRIQTALLPLEDRIRKELPGCFVLNRPKEIVSGDFYWYSKQGNEIFLAVADCTGHGVPGAMMTVIGNNLFNKIINELRIFEPSEILKHLDMLLLETIQRHEIDDEAFTDGMDVALIRFNVETQCLTFAGAKRPLVIIENSNLIELKGDRYSIGWSLSEKTFSQQQMSVAKGTSIYLFSDGYTDQFGGKSNKKFLKYNFYQLLLDIHKKEMYEQHFLLDRKLKLWRGTIPQTDDLMIIGITT